MQKPAGIHEWPTTSVTVNWNKRKYKYYMKKTWTLKFKRAKILQLKQHIKAKVFDALEFDWNYDIIGFSYFPWWTA